MKLYKVKCKDAETAEEVVAYIEKNTKGITDPKEVIAKIYNVMSKDLDSKEKKILEDYLIKNKLR